MLRDFAPFWRERKSSLSEFDTLIFFKLLKLQKF